MLIIQTLAYALLMHELLYICRDGFEYIEKNFLPTFGLKLTKKASRFSHVIFMILCCYNIFYPGSLLGSLLWLISLGLVIASYSLRVSNHLILAWFALAVLVIDICTTNYNATEYIISHEARICIQSLCIICYLFSFFHKLNLDYISVDRSCAVQLSDFYCLDKGITNKFIVNVIRYIAIYGTLVAELSLFIFLIKPNLIPIGILIGIIFHLILGLIGIINFSSVMYSLLLSFVSESDLNRLWSNLLSLDWSSVLIIVFVSALVIITIMPMKANRYCPYKYRKSAWLLQIIFGIYSAYLIISCCFYLTYDVLDSIGYYEPNNRYTSALPFIIVSMIFFLNCFSPYLGLKTEFSLAMFSNLRCEPWNHLVFPASLRIFKLNSYAKVLQIEGLPKANDIKENCMDSSIEIILLLLQQHNKYLFSSYFLRESIKRLTKATISPLKINIKFTEQGKLVTIRGFEGFYDNGLIANLQVNLFPFIMPFDKDTAHTEQGTILNDRQQQLF